MTPQQHENFLHQQMWNEQLMFEAIMNSRGQYPPSDRRSRLPPEAESSRRVTTDLSPTQADNRTNRTRTQPRATRRSRSHEAAATKAS